MQNNDPIIETNCTTPIRVKFTAKGMRKGSYDTLLRQFPDRNPTWRSCAFTFDADAREYDWLVCYDNLSLNADERFPKCVEALACPPEHTLLITVEPSSIKLYGRDFLRQFGVVLTSQEAWAVGTKNTVFSQPALRWFYGVGQSQIRDWNMLAAAPPIAKTADLSTVCSDKKQTATLHASRYDFTHQLKARIPELQIFGHGTQPIDDKAEAIDPFRYHLVIENHLAPHHWTEKLADAYLGMSLPLYVGCPNVADYFPQESFIALPWHDLDASVAIIQRAIENKEYERRLPAILEARQRVLHEYNLFAVLAKQIESHHDRGRKPRADAKLYSRHALRRSSIGNSMRYAWEKAVRYPRVRRLVSEMRPPRAA